MQLIHPGCGRETDICLKTSFLEILCKCPPCAEIKDDDHATELTLNLGEITFSTVSSLLAPNVDRAKYQRHQ